MQRTLTSLTLALGLLACGASFAQSASAPAAAPGKAAPAATAPAPGGGPGKVWVNTGSRVYHCPGTSNYGTTKHGEYMTEAAARAAGVRADNGKACHP